MPGVKGFEETCKTMVDVHLKKCHDYAGDKNPLSNFDVSTYGLSLFNNPRDQAFVWPIFTKLARLATLLNSGAAPNNESIEDSLVDIANYVVLWKCDIEQRKMFAGPYTSKMVEVKYEDKTSFPTAPGMEDNETKPFDRYTGGTRTRI